MQFSLSLNIDSQSLNYIKAAPQNIVIAKPVASSNPNVAWLSFDPFGSNTVTWDESYGIYASTTQFQNGATINKMSEAPYPAQDGTLYTLTPSAVFTGPSTSGNPPPAGTFEVINNMPPSQYPALTFGLEQKATVNGSAQQATPLNAQVVLATQTAMFTPLTTVFVWLQANLSSGTMITQVIGKASIVTFGNGVADQSLSYDPNTGMFVPDSPANHVTLRNVYALA
jgi:hypothetical protein